MRIGKMYDLVNAFFKLDTNDYVPRYDILQDLDGNQKPVQRCIFSITVLLLKALLLCNWLISERKEDQCKIDMKWMNI